MSVSLLRKSQRMLLGIPSLLCPIDVVRILLGIELHWYVRREVLLQKLRAPRIGLSRWRKGLIEFRLLRAAEEALIPGSAAHSDIVNAIRKDHITSARKLIRDTEIVGRVEREIEFECKRLEDFLNAAQVQLLWDFVNGRLSMR